ncbi:cystinosin homolog isoform X2 [Humulus lupulus]|uniref:cystinosin homolog isoform X2 n=1 Tax=Humulus lupulus TaxID=3486 RepID=UPI002B40D16F|nr:cystinosin homolog isoform X2 [Humulus lupulus]
MAAWNSAPWEITYQVMGWIAFLSWTTAGYPQIILNFLRKSLIQVSMVVMSSNILLRQDSWVNFSGNVLNKLLLSLINPSKTSKQKEPLIKSVDQSELENV